MMHVKRAYEIPASLPYMVAVALLDGEVNLFVDHSQIVQLQCLRSGIWGTKSTWGRVLTYKEQAAQAPKGPPSTRAA